MRLFPVPIKRFVLALGKEEIGDGTQLLKSQTRTPAKRIMSFTSPTKVSAVVPQIVISILAFESSTIRRTRFEN